MYPADDKDSPVFVGRFNIGVVSLHLPMILAKARQESRDFYEVLDYYLELIRKIHIRTYAYLGELKASTNPLAYCEGGFTAVIWVCMIRSSPFLKLPQHPLASQPLMSFSSCITKVSGRRWTVCAGGSGAYQ